MSYLSSYGLGHQPFLLHVQRLELCITNYNYNLLAACGHSILDENQILYILGGIGIEYDFVVVNITSKTESITFSEVGAQLMSHEGRLESHNLTGASPPTANTATFPQQRKMDIKPFLASPFPNPREVVVEGDL